MPGKSKAADPASHLGEDSIRQRAYYLWENDGRPMGRDEHYWQLAHQHATEAMVASTATRTARATGGKNPAEMPAEIAAAAKPAKARPQAPAESAAKPAPAKPRSKPARPR